jgi:hypothetical protein
MTTRGASRRPKTMRTGSADFFQTNPACLDALVPFLPESPYPVWECAAGEGALVRGLLERGKLVVASDLLPEVPDGAPAASWWPQRSFLDWTPDEERVRWSCAVTNPPFSLKNQFLARAYDLGRPFAFLLPLTALEARARQDLFRRHGVEIVMLPGRVEFTTPHGKQGGSWFMTAWFTSGLGIGRALTFWRPETPQGVLQL